uniref:DNA-directed RNA polymerase subunit beta n=1 Tax=Pelargonium quinquelobatum TaxID=122256 RepID=A0A1L4BN03_9ROSI|nr:RNA polymerase beta subunit [Pelargonium quinquelobatum]API85007.1 RNA polymerase beta subunit [Pelargonium quinquelobatum]ARU80445.1 RpoB [Pelargonium quinquelobatum]
MLGDRNEGMATIPALNQIQFEGFCRFLDQGLIEELSQFPKGDSFLEYFRDEEIDFQLFSKTYHLVKPLIKERDAIYESLTYSSKLYVSAGFLWKDKRPQKKTVCIGNLPLMNSVGTFIVNGISRVVINQILQSPGIYYGSELDYQGFTVYIATIISDWGGRLKLQIDKKERIWARVSRKQKISILVLSSAMGSNLKEILENACYPEIFLALNLKEECEFKEKEDAILELYEKYKDLTETEYETEYEDSLDFDFLCETLRRTFFRHKCELGRVGRQNINRRLNLDISQNNTFLLPQDILAATNHLIGMKFGMGTLDDMNHLKNKRIRSVADLLQDQFGLALNRLEDAVCDTIGRAIAKDKIPTLRHLATSTPLTTTYESFFKLHPLSHVFDETNPLTHIVHGRKWSFLGPGGLTERTASFRVRDIHPSNYGRICPIDTSEGIKVGLIGYLATHARIGDCGSLESPFYEMSEKSKRVRMLYLSSRKEEYYMIGTGNSLALNQGIQEEQIIPARYRQEFLTIAWEEVHFRSVFPFQYFSIGASLIPFLEHNDATRALMSSNMQRQAVPLSRSEKCIVGTGFEGQVALDSGIPLITEHAGKIISTHTDKILLSVNGETLSSPLVLFQRSNKNTWIHQTPQVSRGNCTKKGQILADGAATVGGELALGKNVLVGYMPWEGYNFEDAVLISERLVYEDIYTSFHIRKCEIKILMTMKGPEKITNQIPHIDPHLLRNLDKNGVVILGSWVEAGDILVGKLTPELVELSPEKRLIEALFDAPIGTTRQSCLKLPIWGRGRVIDVRWIHKGSTSRSNPERIRVYILQKRKIKVGDKVAGRHGNKGIVSKILPIQDMPYLQDGRPLDMVFNPLGVPSRMNVGQIFECSLGLAGGLLDRHYRIAPFDERYEEEASRKLVFSELYEASKQTGNPWVFEPEYPGKSILFDGRTGDPFEQPVIVGQSYILKLIHQVDDKIHGRSTGPYSRVTQQPVKGRARRGGQRVGEMEVWALQGLGVAHILQEILTYKSDHLTTRNQIFGTLLLGGALPKPEPEDRPESFRLLVRELRALSLELNYFLVSKNKKNFNFWKMNRMEV